MSKYDDDYSEKDDDNERIDILSEAIKFFEQKGNESLDEFCKNNPLKISSEFKEEEQSLEFYLFIIKLKFILKKEIIKFI